MPLQPAGEYCKAQNRNYGHLGAGTAGAFWPPACLEDQLGTGDRGRAISLVTNLFSDLWGSDAANQSQTAHSMGRYVPTALRGRSTDRPLEAGYAFEWLRQLPFDVNAGFKCSNQSLHSAQTISRDRLPQAGYIDSNSSHQARPFRSLRYSNLAHAPTQLRRANV